MVDETVKNIWNQAWPYVGLVFILLYFKYAPILRVRQIKWREKVGWTFQLHKKLLPLEHVVMLFIGSGYFFAFALMVINNLFNLNLIPFHIIFFGLLSANIITTLFFKKYINKGRELYEVHFEKLPEHKIDSYRLIVWLGLCFTYLLNLLFVLILFKKEGV